MKWIAVGLSMLAAAYTSGNGNALWLVFLLAAFVIALFGGDGPAVSVQHNHFNDKQM